jgi:uncharacterized circularly permuted ATP-grasp superfamily protein/uncharacterized alpha-E superfamily protein
VPLPSFFHGYQSTADYYDELLAPDGSPRPHWQPLSSVLEGMGTAEFGRRWRQATRMLHENGIAYSAYGDPNDQARPWGLDPLPVVISEDEWRGVSEALCQRATLLDRILNDLYGSQDLLRRGLIPPELLFQNPRFWRPLHGHQTGQQKYLHQYAADLARAPDGKWWVIGDRTEAPSGAGYALENRIITSRMLPDAFHRGNVERLAQYFIALQLAVRQHAAKRSENPRIALLSQGPKSVNYFEDAYLARYLGYTLVVGEDLTVRNNQVMLKTLEGLLPLQVLLRRPNSELCDALELAPTSRQGVSGMLQAVRSGNVGIVNSLGSGLVEAPLLMAFLPRLCREVLGEELKIPGVATWWCGEPASLSHAIAHLDRMVIRPAFRQRGEELQQCKALMKLPRKELIERMKASPHEFVAQEQVSRSTMPTWSPQKEGTSNSTTTSHSPLPAVNSAHIALRAFAVASEDSYYVMNGGLARVSRSADPLFASLQAGEGSKDVWIASQTAVKSLSLLSKQGAAVTLRRTGSELPSRVADNIFWLGRQLERVDAAARLVRTVGLRISAETRVADIEELPAMLRVMAEHGIIEPAYVVAGISAQLPAIEESLPLGVFDESHNASVRSIIGQIFGSASAVRDRISLDCWRIIKRIEEEFRPDSTGPMNLSDLLAMLDALLLDLAAFNGLAMESMTRTHTWRFLDLGRRLERSLQTVLLLRLCLLDATKIKPPLLESLLEICDSLMTYRSRYLANLQLAPVLDLLLTDELNPRSVAYQLAQIVEQVEALPNDPGQVSYSKHQRLAMSALHRVRMLDIHAIADAHASGRNDQLVRFLDTLEHSLPELSVAIAQRYLTHARTTHHLSEATNA